MSTSTATPQVSPVRAEHRMPGLIHLFTRATRPIRAAARTAVFFLKVLPMLPSKPLNWVTSPPVIEHVRYPTRQGQVEGDLYRPSTGGPHPGIIVCLGVVPFGVDNPQLPHLEEALARSGFAALIYWSSAMRDLRLEPEDIENIALAYDWLLEQPYVDPGRSGLIGTCVGGSFALMAAASPLIRDRVAFVGAFAPYSSMWTFAQDIASATRPSGEGREPWQVDQLTRKVYVHSLTAWLEPAEGERLQSAFTEPGGDIDSHDLSADGQALYPLLTALDADEAETALHRLPAAMQERLTALSPMSYLGDLHAPLILFGHDRDDLVIPVAESRRLWAALSGRAGVRYTEFTMFQHVDPTRGKLSLVGFVQQLGKFFLYVYPMFRQASASERGHVRLTSSHEAGPSIARAAGVMRKSMLGNKQPAESASSQTLESSEVGTLL
jgi:Dienelactone hydrolase family